jgi:curved DNA-binding protein CbpA
VKKTLYELVGVPPAAPREIIASACRRRIARLEQDGGEEARAEIFAIREAWDVLGDAKLREAYDASLAGEVPAAELDKDRARLIAASAPDSVAEALLKPREIPRDWNKIRKVAIFTSIALLFAISAIWNRGARLAHDKRLEAAQYEADYGEPMPVPGKAAKAKAEEKPAEPGKFSAEQFEKELREREAAVREQVAKEQTAQEDEFRRKLEQDNTPMGVQETGRRRRVTRN